MNAGSIQWLDPGADSWKRGRGHGVQFHHGAFPQYVIAFLVGYDWRHRPGSPATVEIRNECPEDSMKDRWPEILDDVRAAVEEFLRQGGSKEGSSVFRTVDVWYNA